MEKNDFQKIVFAKKRRFFEKNREIGESRFSKKKHHDFFPKTSIFFIGKYRCFLGEIMIFFLKISSGKRDIGLLIEGTP